MIGRIAASLVCAALLLSSGSTRSAEQPALQCKIGPVTKTYGATDWLVYGCDDGKTVVIVTAAGNPASPFYFMFSPVEGTYRLYGEGTGDKRITDAAHADLAKMTAADIEALIREARTASQ